MRRLLVILLLVSTALYISGCGSRSSSSSSSDGATGDTNNGSEVEETAGPPATMVLSSSVPAGEVLSKSGKATITARVRDTEGAFVEDGTLVTFSAESGSITTSAVTIDGEAEATFQAGTTGGAINISATAGNITRSLVIQVAIGDANSILTQSVEPQTIGIKGAGIEDTAIITFEVRDDSGTPVEDGKVVNFSLVTSLNGGEQLAADSAETAGGTVSVALQAGTVPGTVAVQANIEENGLILTTEARVTIASNRPDAGRITMGATTLNLAGGVTLGLQSEVSAYVGDRAGNVVPDGWPVSFISECGTIGTSDGFDTSTEFGVASATFQTSAPTTPNLGGLTPQGNVGLCRLVAYTPGKGSFQDLNGNGVFDPASDICTTTLDEPYIDANDSGVHETGEYYVDVNQNDLFDTNVVDCVDDSMIWTSMNLMLSSFAQPLSITPSSFNISLEESKSFTVELSDIYGNALVEGTTLTISTDGGRIIGTSSFTMPDTLGMGEPLPITFALASDEVPADGPVPSPKFVTLRATLNPASGENNNGATTFDVATGMINLPLPEDDPDDVNIFMSTDVPTGSKLAQGESAEVTALLRFTDGTLVPDGSEVVFTSSGGTVSPSVATTVNGSASTTFTAPAEGGEVTIKANLGGIEGTIDIDVSSGAASTILVDSISPEQIGVRGSGVSDSSVITFNVLDQSGNFAPDGTLVSFDLSTFTGGGEMLSTETDTTFDGQVSVTLQSGVRSGTAAVTASLTTEDGEVVSTVARVVIAAGLPDTKHFSLSATQLNLEGYTLFGVTSEIRAYLADRYSNPVPVGTPIFFESEAGAMALTSVTTNDFGQATADHITQRPLPTTVSQVTGLEGVNTVLAWTPGAESFVDYNGNGAFDEGEPFQDIGEPYIDANDSGSYDEALSTDNEERYVDVNGNGVYDGPNGVWDGETNIWTDINLLYSYSDVADIVFSLDATASSDPSCSAATPRIPNQGSCSFILSVQDINGNPIYGGAGRIFISNIIGTLVVSDTDFTIPDTTLPGPNRTEFTFTVTNQSASLSEVQTEIQIDLFEEIDNILFSRKEFNQALILEAVPETP